MLGKLRERGEKKGNKGKIDPGGEKKEELLPSYDRIHGGPSQKKTMVLGKQMGRGGEGEEKEIIFSVSGTEGVGTEREGEVSVKGKGKYGRAMGGGDSMKCAIAKGGLYRGRRGV